MDVNSKCNSFVRSIHNNKFVFALVSELTAKLTSKIMSTRLVLSTTMCTYILCKTQDLEVIQCEKHNIELCVSDHTQGPREKKKIHTNNFLTLCLHM